MHARWLFWNTALARLFRCQQFCLAVQVYVQQVQQSCLHPNLVRLQLLMWVLEGGAGLRWDCILNIK